MINSSSDLGLCVTGCQAVVPPGFVPMEFSELPSDTMVVPGQQVVLPCNATFNNQPPDVYSWERNSVVLSILSTGQNR